MDGTRDEGPPFTSDGVARDTSPQPLNAPSSPLVAPYSPRPLACPSAPPSTLAASIDLLGAAMAATPIGFGVLEVVEAAPGVIDFGWTHANPALCQLLGANTLVGRLLLRDGNASGSAVDLVALVTAARGDVGPLERVISVNDHRHLVTATGFGAGEWGSGEWAGGGGPQAPFVTVTLRDAPNDQRADRLRQALEHASDAIALFDADGHLVDYTRKLNDMVPEVADMVAPGATFREMVKRLGKRAPTIPDHVDVVSWIQRRLNRRDGRAAQMAYQSASGRWILSKAWRTPDDGLVTVSTDITAFKEQEAALRESEAEALAARTEAERASRAKSDFLAHMSHELRTPLNAIIGFAELMKIEAFGPLGNERYKHYAEDVLDSGRHLLELVEDALNLSRIDAGRHQLVEEMVNVADEVAATAARHQGQAARKEIIISLDAPISLSPLIADRRALHQMLEHLLSNALKFTPQGGRVQMTASVTPDGGLGIMVADTGIGIHAEDIPKVVEPFGRTETAARHSVDGTGLGLPIVKRLIEMHGGQLCLESEPGVGTTVILTFPVSRVINPGALPFALLASGGGGGGTGGGDLR